MGNSTTNLHENGLTMISITDEANDCQTTHSSHTLSTQYTQQSASDLHYNIDDDDTLSYVELKAISLIPKQNHCCSISSTFRYKKQLGKGASCRVLLVEHRKDNKLFALKEMTRSVAKNASLFYSEVCILRKIKHPNIVQIHNVYMDTCNFYICLEYCSGGTMLERIISDTHFSEQIAANYIKNILETVEFMHRLHIAHLDLKLNNIVFNTDKKDKKQVLKIIDFGLSEEIKNESYIYQQIHGSLHYFPPEIFNENGRKGWELKKGDVWSVGIVSYLILSGKLPFFGNSQKEIIKNIKKGTFDWPKNVNLSDDCKEFILHLLDPDPTKRFRASDALNHRWITGNKNNQNLGQTLMETLYNFNFKSQLQGILINSILSEMNDKEKAILIQGIQELDTNNDGFVDEEDIMIYILQNQLNCYMKDIDYNPCSNKNEHIRKRSEDILLEMKIAMSLIQDSVIRNDLIHTRMRSLTAEAKNDDSNNEKQTDILLEDLMDEIEVDFEDYDFQIDSNSDGEQEKKTDLQKQKQEQVGTAGSPLSMPAGIQIPCIQSPIGYSSNDSVTGSLSPNEGHRSSISVVMFRKIMSKPAKMDAINVDGIVEELDPMHSGIIQLSSISAFGRRLSSFRVNVPQIQIDNKRNENSITNLNESTVILKPIAKTIINNNSNCSYNKIAKPMIHVIDEIDETVDDESDSEIDFPDHLLIYVD